MMDDPVLPNRSGKPALPAVLEVTPDTLHVGQAMPRLFSLLRTAIGDRLGLGHEAFLEGWERWQYLVAVRDWDERLVRNTGSGVHPVLRVDSQRDDVPEIVVGSWLRQDTPRWAGKHAVVEAGAFGGNPERLDQARIKFDESYGASASRSDWAQVPASGGSLPSGVHFPGLLHADPDRWLKDEGLD